MTTLGKVLGQTRLLILLVIALAAIGVVAWSKMPRQEDPPLQRRFGLITALFPGATAETIERLVVEPLEDHVSQVDEIKRLRSRAVPDAAVLDIELRDDTSDFDRAWDEIETAVSKAQEEFPEGVRRPQVNRTLADVQTLVLAITGSDDLLVLADAAERVKKKLQTVEGVSRVEIVADPGEQVTVEFNAGTAVHLGVDARSLAAQLQQRNVSPAGGSVRMEQRAIALEPASEFRSVEEIRSTPISVKPGVQVPLSEIARVRRTPQDPARAKMRFNGDFAVGVGVVPREGINLVTLGEALEREIESLRPELEPLVLAKVASQPEHVASRIADLGQSLASGVVIVAAVLFVAMGVRMGIVVVAVVPFVTFASLAIYAMGSGLLHQISIAALVLALGMLVDNAIVVAESIQGGLDRGDAPAVAASAAVSELAVPLFVATGTTVAAFAPMLLAEGTTAEFTRALPIVVSLTLIVSYLFAILVTPILCRFLLRPGTRNRGRGIERVAGVLARVAIGRSKVVLGSALVALVATGILALKVEQQFFPSSDRNTVIVDLHLAEGTHLDITSQVAAKLETALGRNEAVTGVATFVGRSAPHFYYNLMEEPHSPNLAQLVVTTLSARDNDIVKDWVRAFARRELAGVGVVARNLEQGPPIAAPVVVRLTSDDLLALAEASDQVLAVLKQIPGAVDVRSDLSFGSPAVEFEIDDAVAVRRGIQRADLSLALAGRTRGLEIGYLRSGDDPVPITIRSPEGEDATIADVLSTPVTSSDARSTPIGQVAAASVQWRPSLIRHEGRRRVVSILAQLALNVPSSAVFRELRERLAEVQIAPGVNVAYGGESQGSAEANAAMIKVLPIGGLLLLMFLLLEFNSVRRVGLVLVTVPLALAGIVPGLLLGKQPFGFMSFLGVIALAGIVVNNAIVLLDLVERKRELGVQIDEALMLSIRLRTRPVLLTTVSTIAGLLPLAMSPTTLWPPLAWSMITGLIASTGLTLLVVPALYRLLFPGSRAVARP